MTVGEVSDCWSDAEGREPLARQRDKHDDDRAGMVARPIGGSVLAQFDDVLAVGGPDLAGRVRALAFDPDAPTG
ncbi:hypothetical protein [Streptomyces sp. 1222.5]|uniref:hypothetical protein n=1 Tax=Streptomyces sp. 1222.5 TaxID=1881026 RepID=UPI003EB9F564